MRYQVVKIRKGMNSYKVDYRVGSAECSCTLQLRKGTRAEASDALRKRHEVPPEVGIIIVSIEPVLLNDEHKAFAEG